MQYVLYYELTKAHVSFKQTLRSTNHICLPINMWCTYRTGSNGMVCHADMCVFGHQKEFPLLDQYRENWCSITSFI